MIGTNKKQDIKADVDVSKLIHKNREEQNPILDLSKNNVRRSNLTLFHTQLAAHDALTYPLTLCVVHMNI